MTDDIISELLKTNETFLSLDDKAIKLLLPKFTQVNLKASDILFYQGDASDSVYLLISGKLSTHLMTGTGTTRIIGYIEPGETVGELGALANEPRSLTVSALKDSVLLKLSAADFIYICRQYPKVMFSIFRPMVARTTSLIQLLSSGKRNKHVIIIPANHSLSLTDFALQLQEWANKYPNLLMVSDFQPEFQDTNMTTDAVKEKILSLSRQRKSTRRILYMLSSFNTPLAKYAFKLVNMIYITAPFNSKPHIDHHILDKIKHRELHLSRGPNLVLLHEGKLATPTNTQNWLKLADFSLHHHVCINAEKDMARLLRFIRGKAVGVVLGGGGTRGWAHIGAIKALRKARIPIDIIGGTSVGALVAGCYASNQSYNETYKMFSQVVTDSANSISWRSLTLPILSLFNGKSYTQSQTRAFGDQKIEDLWLPYFCVTSNLASYTEDIQRTGTLWEKIRASTAIPGIIPPMLLNEQLHVDGGLINNLPVDIMRQFVGHDGRIIAIELNTFSSDKHKYNFPPFLTFWDAVFIKLRLKKNGYKFPRFIDTFIRALFVGSELRTRQNSLAANSFISLDLSHFKMLHSNPEEGLKLVKIGYEETLRQLNQ